MEVAKDMVRRASIDSFGRGLAYVSAVLLGGTLAPAPALADEPAVIVIGTDATRLFGPTFLPVLAFGTPMNVQAQSTSGQIVTFTTEGGCSVATILPGTPGGWSTGLLTVTSTADSCRLTASTDAGNGRSATTATYVLRTRMGRQSAGLPVIGRKVAPSASIPLGRSGLTTDREQPIAIKVTNGSKLCRVIVKKEQVSIAVGTKQGQCTVSASAPGIPGEYLPYQRIYVFKVTREALSKPDAAKPDAAKPDQAGSVTSATVA